jgi:hypothetical protein
MAETKGKEQPAPEPPAQPRRFWLYADKKILGPFGVRLLRRLRNFRPDILAAPAGARKETDWKPAAEFPELKAVLDERAAVKPKEPAPKKGKAPRPPLPPLPEGPNYLLWFFLFVLACAAVLAFLVRRGSSPEAPPAAAAPGAEAPAKPEQMWPAPGAPEDRVEAEGQLLEAYFPLLLSVKGVNAEQLAAACDSAKEFAAAYAAYKSKYGGAQLDELSERLTVTLRADARTAKLLQRLEHAASRGVDLSSLKFPQQLRQNLQPSDFSLGRALGNAQQLLSGVCEKR